MSTLETQHQQTNISPTKCRACMAKKELSEMQYLFENNNCEMFHQCSSIEINFSDELPKYVCTDCHKKIIKFIEFRKTCLQSDLFYKQMLFIKVEEVNVKEERSHKSHSEIILEIVGDIKEDTTKSASNCHQNDYPEEYCDNDDLHNLETGAGDETEEEKPTIITITTKEFHCDKCNEIFLNEDQFKLHSLKHHSTTKTNSTTNFDDKSKQTKGKPYKCELISERVSCTYPNCDKSYAERKGLNKHIRNIHKSSSNIKNKNKLNKKTTSTELLIKKSKQPSENYECDFCGKICHKKHRIIGHLRQHLGLKPFNCEECGVGFGKYSSFRLHNQMKHSTIEFKKFACQIPGCTRSYNLNQSLKVHHQRFHLKNIKKSRERKFICESCGKSFERLFDLKEHLYRHLNEADYPFPCKICPKKFISKYRFKVHMMRHNDIRNFVCPICGMRKTTHNELKVHIKYHNNEKSFECKLCPAKFAHQKNVARHIRTVHHGCKPFQCTFCSETFGKSETLKHHIMRHTGEKPHICTICDKRFIQAVSLKTHLKTHNKPAK